jgi:hypothetical protein
MFLQEGVYFAMKKEQRPIIRSLFHEGKLTGANTEMVGKNGDFYC